MRKNYSIKNGLHLLPLHPPYHCTPSISTLQFSPRAFRTSQWSALSLSSLKQKRLLLLLTNSSSSSPLLNNFNTIKTAHLNKLLKVCSSSDSDMQTDSSVDCVGTGIDVNCVVSDELEEPLHPKKVERESEKKLIAEIWELAVLVSPFFFWGTAMVAMKQVLRKTGPFFVSSFRLIPAGLLLVAFAAYRGRKLPSGFNAWFSLTVFALVDATCFQGLLAEGLQRTSAGLGSVCVILFIKGVVVIIDSQPLTVSVLAAWLFGESIGFVGAIGLVLGVVGLLLLEIPAIAFDENNFSLWGSGEWWMLLAAQSMAVGTVMVRWVSKYSDPVMTTGWHMIIGGVPLAAIAFFNHDPAISGGFPELTSNDLLALLYTSIFGSAISYGVYFYNATRGSLTKLSSLTFLTPLFASVFGFFYLGETFSPVQLSGALVTVAAIYMVNYKNVVE